VAAQRVAVWAELPAAAQQAAEGRPAVVLVAQPVAAKPAAKSGVLAVPVAKEEEQRFRRDVQTELGRTHPRSSSTSPVIERRAKGRSDRAHTNSR
jgi:hypothetical protein